MFAVGRQAGQLVVFCTACGLALVSARFVRAQGNVVMGFDALMAINSGDAGGTVMGSNAGFNGFGRFSYAGMQISPSSQLGRYGAFEVRTANDGTGSGMGFNFSGGDARNPMDAGQQIDPVTSAMFPLLDRSMYGINFDPSQYVCQIVYKPLAGNGGDQLNMTLDTYDGFDSAGKRHGEQWQWNFFGLAAPTGTPDADGFYTVQSNGGSLSQANAGFHGNSFMFSPAPLPAEQAGDGVPDFNNFEASGATGVLKVPNGAQQIHLQTPFRGTAVPGLVETFAIKSLRIVKLNPNTQEVARLDGHSGFSLKFGSPFRRAAGDPPINIGGHDYIPTEFNSFANTDQVSRFDQNGFTNIFLKTHDANEVGGLYLYQPASSQVFDGTNATVDVRARLTVPQGAGQADRITIVLKDKDGNDTGAGQGGDEYHYDLMLDQFNTASLTTISVPLSSFTSQTAGEFVNNGDGLLSNFNLYMFGLQTVTGTGAGLVNMEIESIRVMLPTPPGVSGDYNGNGIVDAGDYVLWRKGGPLQNDPTLGVQAADYTFWRSRFGATSGSGASLDSAAVPEPAALNMVLLGLLLGITCCSRRQ